MFRVSLKINSQRNTINFEFAEKTKLFNVELRIFFFNIPKRFVCFLPALFVNVRVIAINLCHALERVQRSNLCGFVNWQFKRCFSSS